MYGNISFKKSRAVISIIWKIGQILPVAICGGTNEANLQKDYLVIRRD